VRFKWSGTGNVVHVGKGCDFRNVTFVVRGDGNTITFRDEVRINRRATLWLDEGSALIVGSRSTFEDVHLAVTEGTKLQIGSDCMFATDVEVRTGDSHSVLEDASGQRINSARSIEVGSHVWVGSRVLILKGGSLAGNCVVAAGSVVTRPIDEPGSLVAGSPASVRRRGINWSRDRL
jgi:acetyltransferase-like isoleucine patch superfamily enzyme